MDPAIVAALASLGTGVGIVILSVLVRHIRDHTVDLYIAEPEEPYHEKVSRLSASLSQSLAEADKLVKELDFALRKRSSAVARVQEQLTELSTREKRAHDRVTALETIRPEALQHFEKMLEAELSKGDRRSAWRDYSLFALGVVVSTAMAIILRYFGI